MGIIPTVAPYLLPLFLLNFVRQFPKVKFSVEEKTTPEIQRELKRRNLDIGIVAIPLEDSELVELPLYSESLMLFDCSYRDRGKRVCIDELDFSRLILLEEEHCLRSQVEQICNLSKQELLTSANFEYKAGSIDSLMRFTKSCKGVTILPEMAALGLSEEERKCLRYFEPPVPIRSIGLVVHKHFVKRGLLEELQRLIRAVVPRELSADRVEGKLLKPKLNGGR